MDNKVDPTPEQVALLVEQICQRAAAASTLCIQAINQDRDHMDTAMDIVVAVNILVDQIGWMADKATTGAGVLGGAERWMLPNSYPDYGKAD